MYKSRAELVLPLEGLVSSDLLPPEPDNGSSGVGSKSTLPFRVAIPGRSEGESSVESLVSCVKSMMQQLSRVSEGLAELKSSERFAKDSSALELLVFRKGKPDGKLRSGRLPKMLLRSSD
eukprot:GHVU01209201.1.p3 GENE.GHVU01209201.1~~GHVU01209201.1.p3  ORF type:complete len:120 (-),score=11.69 GHVU01209201.1:1091-1450(-)